MNRSRICLIALLGALVLGFILFVGSQRPAPNNPFPSAPPAQAKPGDAPDTKISDEQLKTFTWFNSLGFPDVKGLKFARVATGRYFASGTDKARNTYLRGFPIEDTGDLFRVITLSLTTETFQRTAADAPEHARVGIETNELATGAAAYLNNLRHPPNDGDARPMFEISLHPRTETFVLAWACWRNGLNQLAADLFDYAAKTPTGYGLDPDKAPTKPLRVLIAEDLAHKAMWRGIVDFGNLNVSRKQLLERFQFITTHYPESDHYKRADETAKLLRQMIDEDTEHAKKPARPLEELTKKEQIAELIFRLRDQNGHQYTQPGACDIFDDFGSWGEEKKDTAAHQLVAIGGDAIPQLMDALDDQRFTRSVGFHRNFYFSHYVLRVSDCAVKILERIAGRRFWNGTSTFSYMSMDNKSGETKKKIEEWYAEYQKRGEKQLLIDATARGDAASYEQATLLTKRYPDAALPAILAGMKAATKSRDRDMLLAALGEIKDERVLPILLQEVKEGPYAYGRLVAARALRARGRPEGLAAMIAEWQGHRPKTVGSSNESEEDRSPGVSVAEFLAESGKVEAIKALAKDLRKRSSFVRMELIEWFGRWPKRFDPGYQPDAASKGYDDPKALREAIMELLVAELDDTDEHVGVGGTRHGKRFSDPRMCDLAGDVLNRLEPDLYPFDLSAPLPKRDRSLVDLKNVWRKAHGLALLPLPAPKVVSEVPDEKLQPLIEELLRTPRGQRREIEIRIEQLGLGTLPALLKRLDKTGKDDPGRSALEQLVKRVASIVDIVMIEEGSIKPDAELMARIESMKGKAFSSDSFLELSRFSLTNLPTGVRAMRFWAIRDGNGTGVTLKVYFYDAAWAKKLTKSGPGSRQYKEDLQKAPTRWVFLPHVEIGGKEILGGTTVCSQARWIDDKHEDFNGAMGKACSGGVTEPFEIRLLVLPASDS